MDCKICIVSEDKQVLRFLGTGLGMIGYDVYTSHSGEEAFDKIISAAKNTPFAILLTAGESSDISGHSLLRKLNESNAAIPSIAMLSSFEKPQVAALLGEGCVEVFEKPDDPDQLLHTAKSILDMVHTAHKKSPPANN